MTEKHWLLDVIVDLQTFADANGMGAVADHLGETLVIATGELASLNDTAGVRTNGKQNKFGQDPKDTGGHQYT